MLRTSFHVDGKLEITFLKLREDAGLYSIDVSLPYPAGLETVTCLDLTLPQQNTAVCAVALDDPTSNKTLDFSGAFLPEILEFSYVIY